MSRKMYTLLLPVLAVAAMAVTASAAQAVVPKWEICKKEATATHKFSDSECQKEVANTGSWEWVAIPNGKEHLVQVVTFGKLKLAIAGVVTIECKVIDAGNIWNLAAGGLDEITAFTNYECKSAPPEACTTPEIVAKGLPWLTELKEGPIDKITGIKVTVICAGAAFGTFEGTLEPKLVPATEAHPLQAEFTSTTGELTEPVRVLKAKVEGKDDLVTEEDQQVRVK
jgi:hypothetical protein